MERFSALLAICEGNSPVTSESPHKGQWRGALMFSLICVWIRLSKQSWGWWFETLSCPLWRQCNVFTRKLMGQDVTVKISYRCIIHNCSLRATTGHTIRLKLKTGLCEHNFAAIACPLKYAYVFLFVLLVNIVYEILALDNPSPYKAHNSTFTRIDNAYRTVQVRSFTTIVQFALTGAVLTCLYCRNDCCSGAGH